MVNSEYLSTIFVNTTDNKGLYYISNVTHPTYFSDYNPTDKSYTPYFNIFDYATKNKIITGIFSKPLYTKNNIVFFTKANSSITGIWYIPNYRNNIRDEDNNISLHQCTLLTNKTFKSISIINYDMNILCIIDDQNIAYISNDNGIIWVQNNDLSGEVSEWNFSKLEDTIPGIDNSYVSSSSKYQYYINRNNVTNMIKGRNLLSVFGYPRFDDDNYGTNPEVISAINNVFKKLQDKSNSGDFTGLRIGDYIILRKNIWTNEESVKKIEYYKAIIVGFNTYSNPGILFQFETAIQISHLEIISEDVEYVTNFTGTDLAQYLNNCVSNLNSQLFSVEDLNNGYGIKTVSRKYDSINTSSEKLFLPTIQEVFGNTQVKYLNNFTSASGLSQWEMYSKYPNFNKISYQGIFNHDTSDYYKNIEFLASRDLTKKPNWYTIVHDLQGTEDNYRPKEDILIPNPEGLNNQILYVNDGEYKLKEYSLITYRGVDESYSEFRDNVVKVIQNTTISSRVIGHLPNPEGLTNKLVVIDNGMYKLLSIELIPYDCETSSNNYSDYILIGNDINTPTTYTNIIPNPENVNNKLLVIINGEYRLRNYSEINIVGDDDQHTNFNDTIIKVMSTMITDDVVSPKKSHVESLNIKYGVCRPAFYV